MRRSTTVPRKPAHVKWKKTGDTGIVLNLRTGEFFELDPIALAVWKLLDGKSSVAAVSKKLAAAYGATVEEIEKDVLPFLAELQKRKLIESEPV